MSLCKALQRGPHYVTRSAAGGNYDRAKKSAKKICAEGRQPDLQQRADVPKFMQMIFVCQKRRKMSTVITNHIHRLLEHLRRGLNSGPASRVAAYRSLMALERLGISHDHHCQISTGN